MRRLAEQMGIRAPSLYKHVPHKAALEAAIIADGFQEAALAFEAATDGATDPLAALVARVPALRHRASARLPVDDRRPAAA